MLEKGTAGVTHCGRWVSAPAGLVTTRLVCSQPAGHHGQHRAYRWTWTDTDREPVENHARQRETAPPSGSRGS